MQQIDRVVEVMEETMKGMLDESSTVSYLKYFLSEHCSPSSCTISLSLIGHTVRLFGTRRVDGHKMGGAPLSLPKIRKNPLVEIIAINTG